MMSRGAKEWMSTAGVMGAAAMAAVGCTSSTTSPPQSTSSLNANPSAAPSSISSFPTTSSLPTAPATASNNIPCVAAQSTPQQFVGDWTEQGDTLVTTLAGDGTLRSHDGGRTESGTWSYTLWEDTPARGVMPDSAANLCVLWLRIRNPAPALDLVYVPLKMTNTTLQMGYVGHGNTIVWVRSNGNS
jgi:hypothetical protein